MSILLKIIGKWLGKKLIKTIKYKIDLKSIDKYVNKPNELDKQMKQALKTIGKQGKYIEEMEKSIAILKAEAHPPIFSKLEIRDLKRRINKVETKVGI